MSKVYYSAARVKRYQSWWLPEESMAAKMEKAFHASKLDDRCTGEVAVKLHLGEPGSTHYLRPIFASTLVETIRRCGGNPTIIETSGMGWLANRTSKEKHLEAARRNGYTEESIGAGIRMIDGKDGLDSIPGSVAAKGLQDFDSMIVLSHVTGHIQAGFGGAIKNIGLGCVAKPGKYRVHYEGRPEINKARCVECDACVEICPSDAIKGYKVTDACSYCSHCLDACKEGAIKARFKDPHSLTRTISENAAEVLKHADQVGYINLAIDVLPHCDCHPFSDIPMVPDIGVLASKDILAVDRASIDMVNESPGIPNSSAEDSSALKKGSDKFTAVNPCTSWKEQLNKAQELRIGTQEYDLETI